jgi:all-trans-retinol 13,14-reductase
MNETLFQSYKRYKGSDRFDCIIIGSGISGLALASMLSKSGKKVLVLEKHYTPGGYTHTFTRDDWEWDVGVHYIGEVGSDKTLMKSTYDYVCESPIEWADMGEVYDTAFFGTEKFEFRGGKEEYAEGLTARFPEEREAIFRYRDLLFALEKKGMFFQIWKVLPDFLRPLTAPFLRSPYLRYASKTTDEVLTELGMSSKLKAVITTRFGDYGLTPDKSSFVMHAMLDRHYLYGGYYPVGGSAVFFEKIAPVILRSGGEILVRAEVDEILHKNRKVFGVRMADGKEFHADSVVSSAGVEVTYNKLLKDQALYRKLFGEIQPSVAHHCLYLGLEGTPEELNLPKSNYWIFPSEFDHAATFRRFLEGDSDALPLAYISFPAAKDPDFQRRHPGRSTIEVITLGRFDELEKWKDFPWKKRGEEYEQIKENISDTLENILYQYVPQLKGKVIYKELSTPLSTRHFAGYSYGEVYGLEHSPARFRNKHLRPGTHIKGFYLTGQDIVTCGVGGGLMAAMLTATVMLRKNMMAEIIREAKRKKGK